MNTHTRRSIAGAVALASVAGYVDAVGFLSSDWFFVSFMSGNSTRIGVSLGEGNWLRAVLLLCAVSLFLTGVILGSLVSWKAVENSKRAVLLLVSTFLILASTSKECGIQQLAVALLLLAMGAENTVFQREREVSIGVTYMTGTLVKLGQKFAASFHGGSRKDCIPYIALWCGLIGGATLGTISHRNFALHSLWLPAVATLALALLPKDATIPIIDS
jgi:uncharacterized membrane protein YoaK (UPF0700 family)